MPTEPHNHYFFLNIKKDKRHYQSLSSFQKPEPSQAWIVHTFYNIIVTLLFENFKVKAEITFNSISEI